VAGRRTLARRLIVSAVLAALGVFLLLLALFLHTKGVQQANALSGIAALFVAIVTGLAPVVARMLTWTRDAPADLAEMSLAKAAGALAEAQEIDWRQQEQIRKVGNPLPLQVRWQVTDQARAAMAGVSWRDVGGGQSARVAPALVKGTFDDVANLLITRLPARRLVVLGDAGAGKSVLAVRLCLNLLSSRRERDPVPVLLSAASWRPRQQGLAEFAASQLARDHPALGAFIRAGGDRYVTVAFALASTGRLLLVLDGLDEMPAPLRGDALRRVGELPAGMPLVLTSRTDEYLQAVRDAGRGLPLAPAVQLLPLSQAEIKAYLTAATAAPASRWHPVFEHLTRHKTGPLALVLQTPLMVWLARTIYAEPGTTPADLIRLAEAGDRKRIEDYLLSSLVPAVYPAADHAAARFSDVSRSVGEPGHWDAKHVSAYLRFVARHLQQEQTRDFAWWDLNRRVPRIFHGIVGGVPMGAPIAVVVAVVAGVTKGPTLGLLYGLVAGAAVALLAGLPGGLSSWRKMTPSRVQVRIRGNLANLSRRLTLGILTGLSFGAVMGILIGLVYGFRYGILAAIALGPAIGSALSLRQLFDTPGDLATAVSPASILHDDFMSAVVQASMGGVGLGIGACIALLVTIRLSAATGAWVGIAYGLTYGITFGLGLRSSRLDTPAYLPYLNARIWLAAQGKLPWRLMPFLEDAHKRGVLRQQGAIYQFRHDLLQEYLTSE
jgi:hypothetical protein